MSVFACMKLLYGAFWCFLDYCFNFLGSLLASWAWEGVEPCCIWILAQHLLRPATFAKNYTGENVTCRVNKDNPVTIAEERKGCLILFACICQCRNIRECFLPVPSILYCDVIVHIQIHCRGLEQPCSMHNREDVKPSNPLLPSNLLKVRATESDRSKADLGSLELGKRAIFQIPSQHCWILSTFRAVMPL